MNGPPAKRHLVYLLFLRFFKGGGGGGPDLQPHIYIYIPKYIPTYIPGLENFVWTYSSCGASGLNFSLVLTPVELVFKSGILKETKHIIQVLIYN